MSSEENETEKNVELIIKHIDEKKGENIVVLDLRGITSIADFFIIATGNSSVHVKAVADEVHEKMKKENRVIPWHTEGHVALKWVLLDYVDIVVHIFDKKTRLYYSIENLWKDAKIRKIEDVN